MKVLRVFLLFTISASSLACPNGSEAGFDGSCYMVFADGLTWFEAQFRCTKLNGHLVTINSMFTNTFLNGIANEDFPTGTTTYWVGATTAYSNTWTWVDNSNMSYINWDAKQPTNNNGSNCMIQQIRNGKWAQSVCNISLPYICTVPKAIGPVCPSGWSYSDFTKKCYFLVSFLFSTLKFQNQQEQSWNDSLAFCQTYNSSLVSVHSALENQVMSTLAFSFDTSESSFSFWIGLYQGASNNQWYWADGSNNNYTNWQYSGNLYDSYVYAQAGANTVGYWYANSNNKIYGLCQKDANVL